MQSNNNPTVEGKEAIVQFLSNYWKTFTSLEHDLLNIYGSDSAFVLEALNHYKRNDGKTVTLRAVAFTDRNANGLVTSVRFYTDVAPLFEYEKPMKAARLYQIGTPLRIEEVPEPTLRPGGAIVMKLRQVKPLLSTVQLDAWALQQSW